MPGELLLEARGLSKHFLLKSGLLDFHPVVLRAVDDVSLTLSAGETLALVGESGCGKSTLGRLLLRLLEPTGGEILFRGENILQLHGKRLQAFRKEAQIIFQDPAASLNPRKTIFQLLRDPLLLHGIADRSTVAEHVAQLLERVGLTPASAYMHRNPREFSGGQRQRISIARAISVKPRLVVADEAVSALDISIRAQILELLKSLQRDDGIAYLFITHDLAVVRSIAHRVAVMYLGRVVETGPVQEIFENPLHPYTRGLLSATPIPNPTKARSRQRIILTGEIPSPTNPPPGCRFHTRCPIAVDECRRVEPQLVEATPNRMVACHLVRADALQEASGMARSSLPQVPRTPTSGASSEPA